MAKQPCAPCFWGSPDEDCNCPDGNGTGGIKPVPGSSLDVRTQWNQIPPMIRPILATNVPMCEGLPVTPGYKWIWNGQTCSQVVNYDYGAAGVSNAAKGNFLSNLLGGAGASSGAGGFIENNKGLLLIGAAVLAFTLISGSGMKPKTRESVVTTKY